MVCARHVRLTGRANGHDEGDGRDPAGMRGHCSYIKGSDQTVKKVTL